MHAISSDSESVYSMRLKFNKRKLYSYIEVIFLLFQKAL